MKVLCVENCYIDRYYEAGQEYPEYSGPPSPHLKPIAEQDENETGDRAEAAAPRKKNR